MTVQQKSKRDGAIEDYISGMTRAQVCAKYEIAPATLGRWMRKEGVALTPEERKRRRQKGGRKKKLNPAFRSKKCLPGCTCERHKPKAEIVAGRKICTSQHHLGPRWIHLTFFDARERDSQGEAIAWQSHCKACNRITQRIHKGIHRRGKPYEKRQPAKWRTRDERNARRRELHREKMENDAEYADRIREYRRIYAEAKRREAGVPRREFKSRTLPGRYERLLAGPMSKWVLRNLPRYGDEPVAMATKCGVDEATIRRLRDKKVEYISEDLADRILTHDGSTDLWEVYPHLYE